MLFEFHISRSARDRYQFPETLFGAQGGGVIFANFHAARSFAQKMNAKQDLARFPERAVRAGQINAMGLIDEILHLVMDSYRQQKAPQVMKDALDWMYGMLGKEDVDAALLAFCEEFPPTAVYRRQLSAADYLEGETDGVPHRLAALEEVMMLWLANANPACTPYHELFDDSSLTKKTAYARIVPLMHAFFETQPAFGPDEENLLDMLRSPAMVAPHSLTGQLEYIRTRWGNILGRQLYRLLTSLDLVKEEEKTLFGGGLGGPGPARVVEFGGLEAEPEKFSPDKDWMPSLVLLAKNAFVWLDQLSKRYGRPMLTLAAVPDEELDRLARWGFTGLWLIGLWERSSASKEIKIRRGNPEAVASAYSLYDYSIANDLGGDAAYQNLRDRCMARGIRLASDMVPNHTGLDSRWVTEHPDWFVALDYPPFPSYTFNGPNFSPDSRCAIQIEDHYFDNSDAAVVFKLTDHRRNQTRFIYHGNDGTTMPWNDTAQLNYLNGEVREAVIQTILQVARKFSVIRFDAAMTLAKKHYQRLWFPEPGTGGAIPSRAEFGLTKEQFDALMPVEFWREVVDRVAQEVPDTLLLAEAFWLMEGYFVRTLGMHRVYNSAFMNMLRDEKNAEYRQAIKNTLEFDPEILKRYVNFMNNPDERTAVDQFGKGDKYFGICTLMTTLPGLPMFGHGQVEGFTEKYGMEYRRAYWEEQVDGGLVSRHEREVFPLMRKRYLTAEVQNFLFYDFIAAGGSAALEGQVCEDVFAYSNRRGDERCLVLYHNRFASVRGWIKTSTGSAQKLANGEKRIVQQSLAEGLALSSEADMFTIFRDAISNLEYLRPNAELFARGLYAELEAYKCQVLLDFRQVKDSQGHYRALHEYLAGRGVPSMEGAMQEVFLQPVHTAFREIVNAGYFRWLGRWTAESLAKGLAEGLDEAAAVELRSEAQAKIRRLLEEVQRYTQGAESLDAISLSTQHKLDAVLDLAAAETPAEAAETNAPSPLPTPHSPLPPASSPLLHPALLTALFAASMGQVVSRSEAASLSRSWLDEWMLSKSIVQTFRDLGMDEQTTRRNLTLVKILLQHGSVLNQPTARLAALLSDAEVQAFIGVNRYQGILWFNQESFEELVGMLRITAAIERSTQEADKQEAAMLPTPPDAEQLAQHWLKAAAAAGFQVEKLLDTAPLPTNEAQTKP